MDLKASVIIPTYNRKDLTLRAVDSVLKQTYRDFELIVVDDGSSEDYLEIQNLLHLTGHNYLFQDHSGVSQARNTGIEFSKGELIFLLDSDDEWLPLKLEKQIQHFNDKPNCNIVQNLEQWIRNGKKVQVPNHLLPASGDAFLRSLEMCCVSDSSVGFRREVVNQVGLFNTDLRVCEDYDFWIRAQCYFEVDLISEILVIKNSGLHCQLSDSEEALDRFRVYSLFNILNLVSQNLISMNEVRIARLTAVLLKKTRILYNGASKRNNPHMQIYEEILNNLEHEKLNKNNFLLQLDLQKKILLELKHTLEYRPKIRI